MATIEQARKFLNQAKEARNNAIVLSYKLAEMKQTSKKVIASYELAFGGTGKKYDISEDIARIEEKAEQMRLEKDLWLRKSQEIEAFLNAISIDDKIKRVLSLEYLSFINQKKIAQELCYSERHVRRLHLLGLKKVAENLKDVL